MMFLYRRMNIIENIYLTLINKMEMWAPIELNKDKERKWKAKWRVFAITGLVVLIVFIALVEVIFPFSRDNIKNRVDSNRLAELVVQQRELRLQKEEYNQKIIEIDKQLKEINPVVESLTYTWLSYMSSGLQ